MHLHTESMPDDSAVQAILYGPLVLAGKLGSAGLTKEMIIGPEGPDVRHYPADVPEFRVVGGDLDSWIKPVSGQALTFQTVGTEKEVTLVPFIHITGERYSIYWTVA